jgi:hypothetical protein
MLRARIAAAAVLAGCIAPAGCGATAEAHDFEIAGSRVHVEFEPGAFTSGDAEMLAWAHRAADIVTHYYGRFPVKEVTLRIVAQAGEGVHGGKTFANPDAFIRVQVGAQVTAAQLLADWVLVHEMTHLALPDTGDEHAWLSEGVATYVEGVARVQAGNRAETDVWDEELRQMPRGMPDSADHGLDHTHSWGRTYWGGAMFCLLADVDIRQRTHLRLGLQDALRAILVASGGLGTDWPIERVLKTGDAAVGTHTLAELYAKMGNAPMSPDLSGLWRQLGVESQDGAVRLNEHAPLAPVREAIMRAP